MSVTLKTIAERANVSVMAASAALNNTTRTRISAEKREYIRRIAAELGYRPNIMAQKLSGGASHLIGVIIDSYVHSSSARILRGVEEEAGRNGYRILVAEQHESVSGIAEFFRVFEQYGVDGIISLAHDYSGEGKSLKQLFRGQKHVVLWEESPVIDAPYAAIDPEGAFRELIGGWKSSGRIRPAILLNADFNRQLITRTRLFGDICREFGFAPEVIKVEADPDDTELPVRLERAIGEEILPRKVDCVLAENDIWACVVIGAAARMGVRVPEDLAVTGWDNEPFCRGLVPSLASISINAEEIGRRLTGLFFQVLKNEAAPSVAVPAKFFCRESCGFSLEAPTAAKGSEENKM